MRRPTHRLGTLPPAVARYAHGQRYSCLLSGQGWPALVLYNGAGVTLDGWRALYPRIERLGRVFAWNRLGLPGSDVPRARTTGAAVVASARELLRSLGVAPPYVLVGHSLGGLHANLHARLHPDEVAGVLLLEATHPADHALLRKHEPQLVRALAKTLDLPPGQFRANVRAELAAAPQLVREIAAAGDFPPVPLRVVTGGRSPPAWLMSPAAVGARRANQQDLARLSPLGGQVIAHRSGHFPQWSEPRLVLRVLAGVVRACRTRAA